jgi:hypothetical protein
MRIASISITAVVLAGSLFLSSCSPSSSSSSSGTSSSAGSSSSSGSKRSTEDSPLAIAKIQRAVDQALDWTRKGGSATVLGVQELTQENAARADVRFDNFQFNADSYGMPVDKNKKTPPEPDIRDPKFYEKMYQNRAGQIHVERYSGQGMATLKHYNDGRWVLTGVQFGTNGANANIEIR